MMSCELSEQLQPRGDFLHWALWAILASRSYMKRATAAPHCAKLPLGFAGPHPIASPRQSPALLPRKFDDNVHPGANASVSVPRCALPVLLIMILSVGLACVVPACVTVSGLIHPAKGATPSVADQISLCGAASLVSFSTGPPLSSLLVALVPFSRFLPFAGVQQPWRSLSYASFSRIARVIC